MLTAVGPMCSMPLSYLAIMKATNFLSPRRKSKDCVFVTVCLYFLDLLRLWNHFPTPKPIWEKLCTSHGDACSGDGPLSF